MPIRLPMPAPRYVPYSGPTGRVKPLGYHPASQSFEFDNASEMDFRLGLYCFPIYLVLSAKDKNPVMRRETRRLKTLLRATARPAGSDPSQPDYIHNTISACWGWRGGRTNVPYVTIGSRRYHPTIAWAALVLSNPHGHLAPDLAPGLAHTGTACSSWCVNPHHYEFNHPRLPPMLPWNLLNQAIPDNKMPARWEPPYYSDEEDLAPIGTPIIVDSKFDEPYEEPDLNAEDFL